LSLEEANGDAEGHIKKAISLRTKALHKQLEESSPEHKAKVKAQKKNIAAVKADVTSFENALKSSNDIDSDMKKTIKNDLAAMKTAVHSFEEGEDDAKKTIKQKMDSIKKKIASSQHAQKVLEDVHELEEALEEQSFEESTVREMKDNLEHISKDAKLYSKSGESKYKSAIDKRMEAFKMQLSDAKKSLEESQDKDEDEDQVAAEEDQDEDEPKEDAVLEEDEDEPALEEDEDEPKEDAALEEDEEEEDSEEDSYKSESDDDASKEVASDDAADDAADADNDAAEEDAEEPEAALEEDAEDSDDA